MNDPSGFALAFVAVITVVTAVVCVVLHGTTLHSMRRFIGRGIRRRRRLTTSIIVLLCAHTVEIWLFALSYIAIDHLFGLTAFTGVIPADAQDYAYYSAMVYTTVGFGDITPVGAVRLLTQIEAVTGLLMITWSATFTFIEMQRSWDEDGHH